MRCYQLIHTSLEELIIYLPRILRHAHLIIARDAPHPRSPAGDRQTPPLASSNILKQRSETGRRGRNATKFVPMLPAHAHPDLGYSRICSAKSLTGLGQARPKACWCCQPVPASITSTTAARLARSCSNLSATGHEGGVDSSHPL